MVGARTYFQNRLPPGELARILDARERFFLENVSDMDETVEAIQAHCQEHGLTSRVSRQPYVPALSARDLLLLAPTWLNVMAATLWSASILGAPQADLTVILRSNSLLEICYRQPPAGA